MFIIDKTKKQRRFRIKLISQNKKNVIVKYIFILLQDELNGFFIFLVSNINKKIQQIIFPTIYLIFFFFKKFQKEFLFPSNIFNIFTKCILAIGRCIPNMDKF